MGRNTFFQMGGRDDDRPWKIHPLWRGIGCVLIVLIPLLAYAGAVLIMDANIKNRWFGIPREFLWPATNPLLLSQLGIALILSIFGYIVLVIIYLLVYKIFGPPILGPTDSPPIRRPRKGKKFSR